MRRLWTSPLLAQHGSWWTHYQRLEENQRLSYTVPLAVGNELKGSMRMSDSSQSSTVGRSRQPSVADMTNSDPAFHRLTVPVPPMLEEAIGYTGPKRFVAFYWGAGDEAYYYDGSTSGTGDGQAYTIFRFHRAVWPELDGFEFGTDDTPAEHYLLLDRDPEHRALYAVPAQIARSFLTGLFFIQQFEQLAADVPIHHGVAKRDHTPMEEGQLPGKNAGIERFQEMYEAAQPGNVLGFCFRCGQPFTGDVCPQCDGRHGEKPSNRTTSLEDGARAVGDVADLAILRVEVAEDLLDLETWDLVHETVVSDGEMTRCIAARQQKNEALQAWLDAIPDDGRAAALLSALDEELEAAAREGKPFVPRYPL